MKNSIILGFVCAAFAFGGCSEVETPQNVLGLKPVYGSAEDLAKTIASISPQPLNNIGKIYAYEELLFINEQGEGVHVFDNTDPSKPSKIKFISIPGNIDVAIKDGNLYADMGTGMATISIENLEQVELTSFDNSYLTEDLQRRPPSTLVSIMAGDKVYFECPDREKGLIISWDAVNMPKPECYFNN